MNFRFMAFATFPMESKLGIMRNFLVSLLCTTFPSMHLPSGLLPECLTTETVLHTFFFPHSYTY